MSEKLYLSLLNTAYRKNDQFIDDIDSVQKLSKWLLENELRDVKSTEELVFNLQNVRHIIKKILNKFERKQTPDLTPLNMFAEKYKTNHLMQIGRSSTDFFKDTVIFEEPYQSILSSFKEEYKNKFM